MRYCAVEGKGGAQGMCRVALQPRALSPFGTSHCRGGRLARTIPLPHKPAQPVRVRQCPCSPPPGHTARRGDAGRAASALPRSPLRLLPACFLWPRGAAAVFFASPTPRPRPGAPAISRSYACPLPDKCRRVTAGRVRGDAGCASGRAEVAGCAASVVTTQSFPGRNFVGAPSKRKFGIAKKGHKKSDMEKSPSRARMPSLPLR